MKTKKKIHYGMLGCLLVMATACSTDIEHKRTTPSYMDVTTIAEVLPDLYFEVPKTGATTKAVDVSKETATIDKIVCFEDTKNGDHDYNDLVLYIRTVKNGGNIKFQIKPMAMGATLRFGLGVKAVGQDGTTELYNEVIINDVRTTLFNGDPGFINTVIGEPFKDYPINSDYAIKKGGNQRDICKIYFYIVVNGTPMYAGTEGAPMDIEGKPYGIILLSNDFKYPAEIVHINRVYSGCESWFDGSNPYYRFNNPQGDYIDAPFEKVKFN
ncbi:MAG: hypothetical protein LBN06_02400 [Prevotellaceae bacterium]|jgi:hypothetical protein|nr:hypothetical protein [Prevotellaceae bacterium]